MSGVVIDVAAESKSAQEQLRDINRHLAEIVRNTNLSSSALGSLRTDNLKHLSKETKQTAKNFKIVENSAKTSFSNIDGSIKRSGSSLSSLKGLVLTVASSFLALKGINIFNRAADDLTRVQNRLKLVEKDFNSLLITQNKLYSISQATASSLSDTTNVYTSFKRALEDKGLGERTLLNVTKTIQQASALSGSSIEGIRGAILQLNQGISSGTLRGEELNSVLEQLPYLGIELQRGLGMSAGALRKFAEEGKLTTELLLNVIKNMRGKTESDFSKITFTVEMAFNNLVSTLSYFTGALNKFFGSSEGFSKRLFLFSRAIERFAVDTEIAFFTAIRMLDNFKNRLDNFTAIEMTLEALWALKINPFKVIDSYSFYKEMQGIKVVIDKYLYDVKKKGFMESKIDFEIISNIISGEASAKAYKEKFEAQKALDKEAAKNKKLSLKETIFGAGNQTIESSNLFVENLAQSGKLFFEIFKSVYLVIKDVSYVIKAYALPPFALMDKALIMTAARTKSFVTSTIDSYYKVANAAEVLQEAVNPFVIGKNIERAFVDIFRANGVDDLTFRIRTFNNELKAGPNNNYWAELSKTFRPTSGISKVIYDAGRALGFFNYNLYSSATISKKVVDIGLNVITNSFRRLYDQILLPRFGPALIQLVLVIRGYLRQISRLLIGSFNAEYGKFFAEKIIEGFKLVLEYSKKFFVELFRTLTEVGNNQNKDGILSLFKNIFVNLFEFIVSFGFTIIRELYTQTVNLFLNLGNAIRNSINAFEELLTFNIKLNINEEAGKNVARTLINIIKSFSNLFEPLIDNLRSLIDNALSMTTVNTAVSLKLQLLNIFVLLFRTIGQFLKGFAKEIGNALISQLLIVFKNLLEYFSKFTTYIREKITGIFEYFSKDVKFTLNFDLENSRDKITNFKENTLEYLSNSFDKIKEKFSSIFEKLDTNVSLDIDLTVPKEKFNDLKEGILDINLEETSGKFYNFKNELLSYFAELYDKIIGNSYWTDFIDNVEDAPKKLESTEGFFKSFSIRIVDNFKSIYNNTRIFLNSFYSKIKTSVINTFQFISQDVLDKIRLALFIGFTYIFSGEGLRKVIKGGFAIFIIEAFASEFPELSKDIATLLSKSLEESLTLLTEALVFKIQGIIQQLPSLINATIAGLPPAFSIIDYLIPDNTLLYAAFAGALIYLAKAEDAVTNLKTVFLGSFEKIKGGGEKLVEAGFLQYIQDFWFQLQTAFGRTPVPSKIGFANPKIFAVGILASLTALSDSISGLEAAVVGIPLLVYGAIGKAAGNRAFISLLSVMFVKPILIALSASEAFLRKELSAKNPFLKIFDFTNWIKDAITGKGVKKETLLSRIKDNLTGVLENITKNRERYGLRQISLFELLFDTSFKDSILNRKASAFGFKQSNKTAFFEDLVAKASDLKDAFKKSLEPLRANISLFWEAFKINATDAIGKSRRALRSFSDTLREFLSTSFGKQTAVGLALLTITIFFSEAQAASSNASKVIKSNFTEIITAITGLISAIGIIALTYKSLLLLITNPRKVVAGFSAIKSIIVGTFLEISSYFGKLNRENLRAISQSRAAWASLFTFLFKGYRSIFTVSAAIFGVASLQSFSDGFEGIGNTLGDTAAALSSFIIALTTAATLYRGFKAFRRGKAGFLDDIKADFKKEYFEEIKSGSANPFSFEKTIEQRAKKPFASTISGFRAVSNEFSDLGTAVRKSFIDAFAPFGKAADVFSEKWGKGSKASAILAWLLTLFLEISKMPFKIVYNILAAIPLVDALLFAITAPFSALRKGFIAVKKNYKDLTIDTDNLKTKMRALGMAIKAAFVPLAFSAKLLLGIAAIATAGVGIFAGILFGAKGEVGFKVTFNYWFDRLKMLLGMQASSAKGRLYELSSKLRSREIGGNTLDIVKTLVKVDFDKIDKYRYSALSKAADEAADTFNRLEELAIRQGGLTAAQQDEYNKTRSGIISIFNKQPQLSLEMDSYQKAISDMLTDVDNTLLSRIKRFVGLGPVVDANSVSNVRQAVDFIQSGATEISNGLKEAGKVAAKWGGKVWEVIKWVIFPIKLIEWGWAGILGSLEWIGNKLNEFAEWFGRKTEQKPTKENLIVRDYFVELLKPLVKNKAFLTDLEINTIEQSQEDLLAAITEKNTSQQKGLTDAEYSLPGGRDIYNKRINDLEDNIRDLFNKFEKYVIDVSYNAALKAKAQEITQYLTDASLQVKDAFDMTDLGDAFEKSSLNLEESLQLERKADAFKVVGKRIKEAQSERERFYYYARSQNLVAEAKAIEELSKKFGTLKGELEGLTEFSNIFGNIFGSVTRNADREGFDKIIELIKEISSFDISMENYRSGSINYEQESIDYEIEYRKKKLKELQALFLKIPTPDILSVNETLKTLDIKPLDLKVNISDKELEALKQLFIEYAFQVKEANDLKVSPEVRLEALQNSTKTLERIKITSAEINLSKVFSVDNNIVSKLDYIKTIFETEIPNALIASKEALNNWINIKGKLEDTKNKISQAYLKQDYDGLKTATEDLQKLELGMKIIEESVNPNALNDALSSLNLEIPQENTKKLSENIKEFITKASILANAETTTVEQKLVIEATIKDIIFKENLPTEISSMDTLDKVFSKLNIDTSIIGNYSEENIKNFEKLYDSYNRLEYAQDKFLKQKDYKNFIKARQLIQDIDKNVEALGKTLLDTKSKITEVFNIEIDDRTLFELSSVLRKQISDAAKYFEDGFKKISEGATVVGGKTISMFFDEFENYKNSSKILTFISKISTQSREILKGGIKNAYEQLNKYIPKLKIDTFLEIPGNLGKELANRLARNDTLKEFILEVNLDEKQLKRINELLSTNLSGEEILKELKFEFPELKTDAEKSTEDLLNSTRELTEGLAAEKDAVKTLEESIRKLTEAVYIVSPLNTQNYSPIPKKNFKERSPDELFPLPEKAIAQGYLKTIESLDKIILSGFENSFQQFEETFRAIKDQEAYLEDSNKKLEFLLIGNEYSNRIITPNEYKPENITKQFETIFAPLTEIYKRIKEKEIELSKIEDSFVGKLERNLVENQIAGLKETFEKIAEGIREGIYADIERVKDNKIEIEDLQGNFAENLSKYLSTEFALGENRLENRLLEALEAGYSPKLSAIKAIDFEAMDARTDVLRERLTNFKESLYNPNILLELKRLLETPTIKDNPTEIRYIQGLIDSISKKLNPEGLLEPTERIAQNTSNMLEKLDSIKNAILGNKNPLASNIVPSTSTQISSTTSATATPFYSFETPVFPEDTSIRSEDIANLYMPVEESFNTIARNITENALNNANKITTAYRDETFELAGLLREIRDNVRPTFEFRPEPEGVPIEANALQAATGGYISGLGTGTSDSIPAMLSNGEYVINAKASKKYGAILHAINSGMELPGFKNGRTDAVRYIDPSLVHIALTKLVNELGMQTTAINALMQTIAVESSFFLDAKNQDSEASGLIQFTKQTAKKLGTDVAAIRKMTLDEQMELIKKYLEGLGSKSKQIKDREDMYMAIFAPSGIGKSDDFVLYSKDKSGLEYTQNKKAYDIDDNGEITRGEALSAIRKQKDYVNPVTENSTNSAINDNLRNLESQNFKAIYVALNSFTDINERLKYKFDELGVSLEESLIQTLPDNTKKVFDELTNKVLAANIVVKKTSSKDILAYKKAQMAAREAREELNKFAENLQYITQKGKEFNDNFFDGLKTSLTELIKGTESTGKIWENLLDSISNSVINTFLDGLFKPFKDENVIGKLGESISSQGLGLGGNFLGMFGTKTKQTNLDQEETSIFDFFKNLFSSKTESTGTAKASSSEYYTDDWGVGSVATTGLQQAVYQPIAAMQAAMSNTCGCIQQALAQNPVGTAALTTAASQSTSTLDYTSDVKTTASDTNSKNTSLISDSVTTALTPLFNQFTSGISTIFGGISSVLQGGFSGLLGIGVQLLSPILGMFGIQMLSTGTDVLMLGGITTIVTLLGAFLPLIYTALLTDAMLPFASGGYVSGIGTSTSDSIPAMLSNGEYVINAKATKQYAPLLDAINNGRFSKIAKGFATGGLVGATVIATPAYSDISTQKANSQQVVNINITGDISRQTKAEIYRMIPEITSGVNTVNKSRNYRG